MRRTNQLLSILLIVFLLLAAFPFNVQTQAESLKEASEFESETISDTETDALFVTEVSAASEEEVTGKSEVASETITESKEEAVSSSEEEAMEAEAEPSETKEPVDSEVEETEAEAELSETKAHETGENEEPQDQAETIEVTLIVEGSKILQSKADKENAHEEWLRQTLDVAKDTVLADVFRQAIEMDSANTLDMTDGWINSIEIAGYPANITGMTNGSASSWIWYLQNRETGEFEMGELVSTDQMVSEADVYKLQFMNDPLYPPNVQEQSPENPIELKEDVDSGWTGYRGDAENKTAAREVDSNFDVVKEENWSYLNENKDEWGFPTSLSDLLTLKGKTYYATSNQLIKLAEDGSKEASLILAGNIQYFSRLAYGRGMIIVPLEGGGVQAVDPDTMQSLWVVASKDAFEKWTPTEDPMVWEQAFYDLQSLGSTYIDLKNGVIYVPISASGPGGSTVAGMIRAIDMSTGKELWSYSNSETGYYWGGAAQIEELLFIGNDQGKIEVLDKSGKLIASSDAVSAGIRSTIVSVGNTLYFTSRDGVFHSIEFDFERAVFANHQSLKFASASTSTPTIHQGKAYVGGAAGNGTWGDPGVFAIIDLQSMSLLFQSSEIVGEVKSAPLVIYNADGLFVYFTANTADGLLYVYHDGMLEVAYRPTAEQAQYTTATPIIDANGNIYYTTDAAVISLFAKKIVPEEPEPADPTEPVEPIDDDSLEKEPSVKPSGPQPSSADSNSSIKPETTTEHPDLVNTGETLIIAPVAVLSLMALLFIDLRKKFSRHE